MWGQSLRPERKGIRPVGGYRCGEAQGVVHQGSGLVDSVRPQADIGAQRDRWGRVAHGELDRLDVRAAEDQPPRPPPLASHSGSGQTLSPPGSPRAQRLPPAPRPLGPAAGSVHPGLRRRRSRLDLRTFAGFRDQTDDEIAAEETGGRDHRALSWSVPTPAPLRARTCELSPYT